MKPDRPPDFSRLIQLPTEEALGKLRAISESHPDSDTRLLAVVLWKTCLNIENICKTVAGIGSGKSKFVSFDGPDAEPPIAE